MPGRRVSTTHTGGAKYEGAWLANKRHGDGVMTFPSGKKYVGQWEDDKQHGQGTLTYNDGSSYCGMWQNDKKHGMGTLTSADGTVLYKGNWKNDQMDTVEEEAASDAAEEQIKQEETLPPAPSGARHLGVFEVDRERLFADPLCSAGSLFRLACEGCVDDVLHLLGSIPKHAAVAALTSKSAVNSITAIHILAAFEAPRQLFEKIFAISKYDSQKRNFFAAGTDDGLTPLHVRAVSVPDLDTLSYIYQRHEKSAIQLSTRCYSNGKPFGRPVDIMCCFHGNRNADVSNFLGDCVVKQREAEKRIKRKQEDAEKPPMSNMWTPLHWSLRHDSPASVIKTIADVFVKNADKSKNQFCKPIILNQYPLHIAAEYCSNLETLQLVVDQYPQALLEKSKLTNRADGKEYGLPLDIAININQSRERHYEVVKFFEVQTAKEMQNFKKRELERLEVEKKRADSIAEDLLREIEEESGLTAKEKKARAAKKEKVQKEKVEKVERNKTKAEAVTAAPDIRKTAGETHADEEDEVDEKGKTTKKSCKKKKKKKKKAGADSDEAEMKGEGAKLHQMEEGIDAMLATLLGTDISKPISEVGGRGGVIEL